MAKAKKGGGGKLSRSETVTVRLDPQLNYLCEIAARINRQTKSSFIERAIQDAVARTPIRPNEETLWSLAGEVWDVDEADRFVKLALQYPELLTYDEQVLWKTVCGYEWYWSAFPSNSLLAPPPELTIENAQWRRLRADWEKLKLVAKGELDEWELGAFDAARALSEELGKIPVE